MSGWTCFHCDENFTDRAAAALHFGADEDRSPACQIKAGAEMSMLKALRSAEDAAEQAMAALHAETTGVHRAMREAASRHQQALVAAEELGFERGMRDSADEMARLTTENERLAAALDRQGNR